VTFLFTDIEGSTRLWQEDEEAMRAAVARHDNLLREAVDAHDGVVFSTMGDGLAVAFSSASSAVRAALGAQRALAAEQWPTRAPLRVRMGLHTGEAELREGDYFGTAVNRAARLMGVGHGGQVLCSQATAVLIDAEAALTDLGEHRLRDLDRPVHVFQLGDGRFPGLRSLDAFPGNLPLQVSSFVGRERELEQVVSLLGECRVVTLTGVGGVGKTRLALQVAAEVLPRFREGAWLVELAPVRDEAAVADAVAAAFGVVVRAGLSVEESLVEFLRGKQLLLVADNCEHLLEPVAELLDMVQRLCPQVVVLATSREGLALDGERMVAVPSLAAPRPGAGFDAIAGSDAVRLFMDRARQADSSFSLTEATAPAVLEVCRRLDGVPLAIELAAARVGAMTPAELAAGLDRRFEMITGARRRAVKRHQTLRAAIDWSYELCSEAEQRLLARLAVFAGGCARDAAEVVCGWAPLREPQVLGLLTSLVAKSVVVADRGDAHTRYRLLETIREYGEERLDEHGETSELRGRHARFYAALLAALFPSVLYAYELEGHRRLDAEQDDVALAMQWAVDTSDVELALTILCHLPTASVQADHGLVLPAEPVLALPGADDHPDYPMGIAVAAFQATYRGDLDIGERFCEQALAAEARLGTRPDSAVLETVAWARALAAMASGSWHEAAEQMELGAEFARRAGHPDAVANHLAGAASDRSYSGDHDAAVRLASEALALARPLGHPVLLAHCLTALANALSASDQPRARECLRESFEISSTTGYETTAHVTEATLVAAGLRDRDLALELAARAIPRLHWNGDRPMLAGVVSVVAWAAAPAEPETAAVLQSAARRIALAAIAPVSGTPDAAPGRTGGAGLITDLRREAARDLAATLGEERLRQLRAEGDSLGTDAAVATALDVIQRIPLP